VTAPAPTLEALALACRRGAEALPTLAEVDIFNTRLAEIVAERLDVCDRAGVEVVLAEGEAALNLTRRGLSDEAAAGFQAARRRLALAPLGRTARWLAESLLCAQEAYFEYRHGRFDRALARLSAAYRRDLLLERAGFAVLAIHRVQLANNRMRLERRRGRLAEALALGSELLHYLERPGEPPSQSLPAAWRGAWIDHRLAGPPELAADMHRQIAREQAATLEALEARAPADAAAALRRLNAGRPSQASRWSDFHIARLTGSDRARHAAAYEILVAGPKPSAPLWRSVALAILAELASLEAS
jgi:hypothetical protein